MSDPSDDDPKRVWRPGVIVPPKPLSPLPPVTERIIVTKSHWGCTSFEWMWLVRDADGRAVGMGLLEEVLEIEVRIRAAACFALNFDEPLPQGFEGLLDHLE